MDEVEFNELWIHDPTGVDTLTYRGATVEIAVTGEGIDYTVNGERLERFHVKDGESTQSFIVPLKRRVHAQWENGVWPPQ